MIEQFDMLNGWMYWAFVAEADQGVCELITFRWQSLIVRPEPGSVWRLRWPLRLEPVYSDDQDTEMENQ